MAPNVAYLRYLGYSNFFFLNFRYSDGTDHKKIHSVSAIRFVLQTEIFFVVAKFCKENFFQPPKVYEEKRRTYTRLHNNWPTISQIVNRFWNINSLILLFFTFIFCSYLFYLQIIFFLSLCLSFTVDDELLHKISDFSPTMLFLLSLFPFSSSSSFDYNLLEVSKQNKKCWCLEYN